MIISTDTEKAFHKIQNLFHDKKTFSKLATERTLLNMKNRIYGKPTASTIFKVKNGNLSL